jgi:hypothetical protein
MRGEKVGKTGGLWLARFLVYMRPAGRPSGVLPSTVLPAPDVFGKHTAIWFEGRTWGFITQPRTAAQPTRRHRLP